MGISRENAKKGHFWPFSPFFGDFGEIGEKAPRGRGPGSRGPPGAPTPGPPRPSMRMPRMVIESIPSRQWYLSLLCFLFAVAQCYRLQTFNPNLRAPKGELSALPTGRAPYAPGGRTPATLLRGVGASRARPGNRGAPARGVDVKPSPGTRSPGVREGLQALSGPPGPFRGPPGAPEGAQNPQNPRFGDPGPRGHPREGGFTSTPRGGVRGPETRLGGVREPWGSGRALPGAPRGSPQGPGRPLRTPPDPGRGSGALWGPGPRGGFTSTPRGGPPRFPAGPRPGVRDRGPP